MQGKGKAATQAALHTASAFLRSCSLKCVATVALLILFVSTANAQLSGKGSIQGTVVDPTGAVIPGANVTVVNTATNVKQVSTTTSSGDYNINVEPGSYTVTVSMSGFKSFTQENVKVNAMETAGVNVTLQTGDASETITVTDAPPAIETSNATLGATMEQEMYAALPVMQDANQRRATDFASLMPGVQSNVTNGSQNTNTGNVNGASSRGAVSSVYINGVPITSVQGQGDPRFIWTAMPLEAINQFQVQTVGYSAIYEGQGVQNYVVKSGTNKFHGGVFDYFRNTALDTWGFMAPAAINAKTGKAEKPIEHQNEYGIYLGGPVLKDKLFYFGVFEGYRYAKGPYYAYQTNPTSAMMSGNFAAYDNIYDPKTTKCPNSVCSRAQFTGNAIPDSRISTVAKKMQSLLPALTNQNPTNNYLGGYSSGLSNWSMTHRLDWNISPSHSASLVVAAGRQSTTGPAGQTSVSSTSNQAPAPFITVQAYAPKTAVVLFEDTYTINPHVVNQFKFGFGRYDAPGFSQSIGTAWAASTMGFTGIPVGQAAEAFPKVSFSGTWTGNQWAGYTDNKNVANSYIFVDSVQWLKGKHSVTFGGQIAWMQYNYTPATSGTTPLQLTFNSSETASFTTGTTLNTTDGHPYASYLLGAVNSGTFTQNAAAETGARFRPISPYVQDDWKVSSKLTVNLGLRWDYYPSYREVQDRMSWMDPTKTNSLVGVPGALVFAGNGDGRCNCRTNVKDYYKNFGPRIGFAYQSDAKTVWRGSWGVIYSHGNNVGGSAQSRQGSGIVGFSAAPKSTVIQPSGSGVGTSYWNMDDSFPTYKAPPFISSTYGTYYTTASSTDVVSQTVSYADPYYGGRAPQFINWSFGLQRQITNDLTLTASYVGSMGHFLYVDSNNGRGYWTNQLDPKWLSLKGQLSNKATDANLAAAGVTKPYSTFNGSTGTIAQALKPFPQYSGVSDAFGQIGNSDYHALQVSLMQRTHKNLTYMVNYTWSKGMDNSGTFRSGYDIPAAYATDNKFHAARTLDRSLSTGHQPHRIVVTGTYALPFGKGHMGDQNLLTRSLLSDWKFSEIFQAYSGSPMAIIMGSCNTNPSQVSNGCVPMVNPSFTGKLKPSGSYGNGATAANIGSIKYINPDAFKAPDAYMFSTTARTAPLNIYNSGNYNLDLSLRRAFPLKFQGAKLNFEADMFNVTNHTRFGFSSQSLSWQPSTNTSSSFGTVSVLNNSRTVQLAARIEF